MAGRWYAAGLFCGGGKRGLSPIITGVKFAKGVAGVIPGTIGAIKEIGLGAYDAIGASTYSALNYLAGSNVAYEPTGAIGASVQQRGWLPTIGDGVHGVVTNLPGVGLIGGVMHNDPEAMGSGIVGLAPLGMVRSAGRVGEVVATNSAGLGKNPVFFTSETTWTAPSKATGLQYKVFQQEIDWSLEVKGVTNLERAQGGGAPYIMKDGVPQQLQLHHSRQNGQGPLFELSRSTHLETKATEGGRALHPYGRQQHPDFPVNRPLFNKDVKQYWMDRAGRANQ